MATEWVSCALPWSCLNISTYSQSKSLILILISSYHLSESNFISVSNLPSFLLHVRVISLVLFGSCNVQIVIQNSLCIFYFPCTYTPQLSRRIYDETWKLRLWRCLLAQPCATVRLTSFLWTKTINHKPSLHLRLEHRTFCNWLSSHTLTIQMSSPYFDSKCKINKAVIISGVSKLDHNTVTTENLKPRVDVSEKGNVTMRRFRATIVAIGKAMLITQPVCMCVGVCL